MGLDFYHHLCNTCLASPGKDKGGPKFQCCSGCKLVAYCSRSHQKADWKEHKSFCMEVQKIIRHRNAATLFSHIENPTHQIIYDFQTNVVDIIQKQLNRSLTFSERSMIYFPDICGLCLRPNGNALIYCWKCKLQFYCSDEDRQRHSRDHEKDCSSLKLSFELFMFLSNSLDDPPSKVCQKELTPQIAFPRSLEEYFSKTVDLDNNSIFDKLIFSDVLSYMLTLIYSIRESISDYEEKQYLRIHILGATQVESYMLTILDVFFVWFEKLKSLDLIFIGPDCPPHNESYINSIVNEYTDRRLNIQFHSGILYHDFVDPLEFESPHVIVAFNCGFHEFKGQQTDTWKATVDFVLRLKNVVLVTTSYTLKEALEDSEPFVAMGDNIDVIKLCEKNQFKSLNPHRNPERSESAVFFFNQFLSLFYIK